MNALRRFVVAISAVIFFFTSIGLAWSHVASSTLRNRDKIKDSLSSSSVYDNIVDVALEGLANSESENSGEVPVDDPNLQAKVRTILNAAFLRSNSEAVIDGVYNWLEGDVEQPDFQIDLSGVRTQLAAELGNYAAERVAGLPVCSEIPAQYDALTAECVLPGATTAQVKQTVEQEFLSSDGFFNDATLTAADFKDPETGQSIFADTQGARSLYQMGSYAPYILAVLVLLTAAAILFLSSSRRAGALRLGIIITVVAIILGITYASLSQGPKLLREAMVGQADTTTTNPAGEKLIVNVFETFANNSRQLIGLYAFAFAMVAAACYVAYASMSKHDAAPEEPTSPNPTPPIDDSPKHEPAQPAAKSPNPAPKKTRNPPKIQL